MIPSKYKKLAQRVDAHIERLRPSPPSVITLRAIAEEGEAPEEARVRSLAAHLAAHPEDKDQKFFFVTRIVIRPQPAPAPVPKPEDIALERPKRKSVKLGGNSR